MDRFLDRQAEVSLAVTQRVLTQFPPTHPEPQQRRLALLLLDGLLHDLKAPNRASVQGFFHNRIERATSEIEQARVAEGAVIWKLYDHAFVVRTATVTVAFDLTRAYSARVLEFALADDLMTRLIRQCDALFISHRHGDHADEWVAQQFIEQRKPVAGPEELWSTKPVGERLRHLARDPERIHLLPVRRERHTLKVVVFPGHQGANIVNNVTLVRTPEGLSFCHTGDQSNTDDFSWIDQVAVSHSVDVLLPNCWATDIVRMIQGMAPALVITGHENELGHSIDHREPYWLTYERLEESRVPFVVMTWGESIRYRPSSP